MIKWIIIIAVVIIAIIVIAAIVDGNTEPSTPTKRYTPPTPSPQRQVAAQRAAAQMNNQQMRNAGTERRCRFAVLFIREISVSILAL